MINANSSVWQNVGGVKFHSGQTPLIFDPVSTVAFGYASCTGVSTTYIAALRVAGVPARLVGTPAWLGDPAGEPQLGRALGRRLLAVLGGPTRRAAARRWRIPVTSGSVRRRDSLSMEAPRSTRRASTAARITRYPAWDPFNLDTPGVDRTDAYGFCSHCWVCYVAYWNQTRVATRTTATRVGL